MMLPAYSRYELVRILPSTEFLVDSIWESLKGFNVITLSNRSYSSLDFSQSTGALSIQYT